MSQAAKRQQELKDPQLRDDLAAARAILKKHSTMLLTASKVRISLTKVMYGAKLKYSIGLCETSRTSCC